MLTISLTLLLTGCFQGEQSMEEMDPPQDAEGVDSLEEVTTSEEELEAEEGADESSENEDTQTVTRELFLLDANGMVAPQTLELPQIESKEVAKQSLEYLVKGGPVTSLLPNGFEAVLPEGTEILGLNLQEDGTMVVDVSNEFENYQAEDEAKILQSMTYTLTQFESVDEVELQINGHKLQEMPVNGTPINDGYSRANGINVMGTDALDVDAQAVTMYYPAEFNENQYFVPVTQHIEVEDNDIYSSIVNKLMEGPGYNFNTTHVFSPGATLLNSPNLDQGVLELVFSQEILHNREKGQIADEVMETLVRTLTEQQAVEAVQVKVEDVEEIFNENGEAYGEQVTLNDFEPAEKF